MPHITITADPNADPNADRSATDQHATDQHSLVVSIAHHLVPGVLILGVAVAALPLTTAAGFPPLAALAVAILVGQLPIQLGHLLLLSRRAGVRLTQVHPYQRRLPRPQYALWALTVLGWGAAVGVALAPVSAALTRSLFAWMPAALTSLTAPHAELFATYPRWVLVMTFGAMLILNGLVAPIVEELYFRGCLLPRLSRFGAKAPLLESALFTVYHLWQPWQWPILLLTVPAFIIPTYRSRCLMIAISSHCALNLVGGFALFAIAFR